MGRIVGFGAGNRARVRSGVGGQKVGMAIAVVGALALAAIGLGLWFSSNGITMPHSVVKVPVQKVAALVVFGVIFIPLEKMFALHKQRTFRTSWRCDVLFFWLNSFFAVAGTLIAVAVLGIWMRALLPNAVHHAVRSQPVWAQFVEAVLLSEIGEYWAHRKMHTVPFLWRFHKVHHSVDEMDWLASARLHPVDRMLTASAAYLPLFILGFSTRTIGVFGLFAALQALAVHSNVRFTFPPLRYLLATPQYHHWHHASDLYDHNYAAQLPLVDWMFRSLYVPGKGKEWPRSYGIEEPAPTDYLGQLAWPFRNPVAAPVVASEPAVTLTPIITPAPITD
jgi:sterol desaturase/sphingolipid hydroxylase (fatty acid hydroxylase superfamily)